MIILRLKNISEKLYKNEIGFLLIFIFFLFMDVSMKFNPETEAFRYLTKPFATLLLIGYVYFNASHVQVKRLEMILIALSLFLIGDIVFINRDNFILFNVALLFYLSAKIFFMRCFFNENVFKVSRLMPFLILSFLYLTTILYLIFDNLSQKYLLQVLVYFFVVQLVALFAFLRAGAVSKFSFIIVFFGVLISFVSDGVTALNLFSNDFHYNGITSIIITIAYGVSQYLIVVGLLNENSEKLV